MKRFLGHCMAGVTVLVAAATAAPACVHNDKSVFIHSVKAPPVRSGSAACLYTNDPTSAELFTGEMDLAFRTTYDAVLLVGNQMVSKSSAEQNRSETSRVLLQGATVRVTDSGGTEISSFTRLGSGVIEPSSGTLPSYGLITTTLIDPTAAKYVASTIQNGAYKRLVSYVRVFGETLGGESVETNEYQFAIDVCYRCEVAFPADSVDKALAALTGHTNCLASDATVTNPPCLLGQDGAFSCTLCSGLPVCDPTYVGTAQSAGGAQSQAIPDAGGGG